MTREELDVLEEDLRKQRAAAFAHKALTDAFNKAWQQRHNRTFMQACQRSWRSYKLKEHGGRYHKAQDRWVEVENDRRTNRPGDVPT